MTKQAFIYLVKLAGSRRVGKIYENISNIPTEATVIFAPTNITLQPTLPEEMVGTGRQFVVIADQVHKALGRAPRRLDRIEDPILGIMTVEQVREMCDIGGAVMGYRLWVE